LPLPLSPHYLYLENEYHPNNRHIEYPLYGERKTQPVEWGLEQFIRQKQELILSKLHMLQSEIYQRHKLKEENIYQISLDQCTCKNLILLMGESSLDRKRIELERKIIDLEQEKRKEKTGYFQDTLLIRKDFRETLLEKLEEEHKTKMLVSEQEG
jgi:hypothetical protein